MKYLSSALLLASLLIVTYVMAHVPHQPAPLETPGLHDKHEIVRLFMDAVKRGELVVLGHLISRDVLKPVRVIYTYELNSTTPEISIYSVINPPLDPGFPDAELQAVSVSIHPDGSILDVTAHIWPKTE